MPRWIRNCAAAFRIILAIPHLIIVQVWAYLTEILAVIQWFIVLFTGRRNEGLWNLQNAWLGYYCRVYGYVDLLYDPYPAFGTDPGPVPVRTQFSYDEPADRLTNGLRFIWAIPAIVIVIYANKQLGKDARLGEQLKAAFAVVVSREFVERALRLWGQTRAGIESWRGLPRLPHGPSAQRVS